MPKGLDTHRTCPFPLVKLAFFRSPGVVGRESEPFLRSDDSLVLISYNPLQSRPGGSTCVRFLFRVTPEVPEVALTAVELEMMSLREEERGERVRVDASFVGEIVYWKISPRQCPRSS